MLSAEFLFVISEADLKSDSKNGSAPKNNVEGIKNLLLLKRELLLLPVTIFFTHRNKLVREPNEVPVRRRFFVAITPRCLFVGSLPFSYLFIVSSEYQEAVKTLLLLGILTPPTVAGLVIVLFLLPCSFHFLTNRLHQ